MRKFAVIVALAFALAACNTVTPPTPAPTPPAPTQPAPKPPTPVTPPAPPQAAVLNGEFHGEAYSDGLDVGEMGMRVTTSGGIISGQFCFWAVDGRTACNYLTGAITASAIHFTVGTITFAGTWTQDKVTVAFVTSDAVTRGTVTMNRTASTASVRTESAWTGGSDSSGIGRAIRGITE